MSAFVEVVFDNSDNRFPVSSNFCLMLTACSQAIHSDKGLFGSQPCQ